MPKVVTIRPAQTPADLDTLCTLLREYATPLIASVGSRHLSLPAFETELAGLPLPFTALLLASIEDGSNVQAAGCILFKPHISPSSDSTGERACEMKRLWVRPQHRGLGIGRQLIVSLIDEARRQGFSAMYLDTLPASMDAAHRLYLDLGFTQVERYNDNPVPDVVFFRRALC